MRLALVPGVGEGSGVGLCARVVLGMRIDKRAGEGNKEVELPGVHGARKAAQRDESG